MLGMSVQLHRLSGEKNGLMLSDEMFDRFEHFQIEIQMVVRQQMILVCINVLMDENGSLCNHHRVKVLNTIQTRPMKFQHKYVLRQILVVYIVDQIELLDEHNDLFKEYLRI